MKNKLHIHPSITSSTANFWQGCTSVKPLILAVLTATLVTACSTMPNKLAYDPSFLLKQSQAAVSDTEQEKAPEDKPASQLEMVKPFSFNNKIAKKGSPIIERFSADKKIQLAADELPLNEFLHYVMGEVLQVSYILGEGVKKDVHNLTLNLIEPVSHRKIFSLLEALLAERNYVIRYNDGIYYINQEDQQAGRGEIIYGFGNQLEDVPETSQDIWQLVPFTYAFNASLQFPLMQIAKLVIKPDAQQNMFILQGKRSEIIKGLEFMRLFDTPDAGKKHIAMYQLEFSDTVTLMTKLTQLLKQEGISVGAAEELTKTLSVVTLDSINTLAFFANSKDVIERALFWLHKIDLPEQGEDIQYFIYAPQFSRAADLGESLQALLGASASVGSATSAKNQNKTANSKKGSNRAGSSAIGDVGLVVDERANSLIFQTSGDEYRKLLPLIKRLDVMPKQIMLEVVIAEVQLTDEFEQGVSFSLTNNGVASASGSFNLASGSSGLSYLLNGIKGTLDLNLFQSNTHVNILSRPSLLVRDGVGATITVGNDIPTVGEIITDPVNGSRSSVVYRKTGVDLAVTPTINAQGVVLMEISQKISNQAKGSGAVAGSPIIFERSINTEVVAESGQTIILGGLISEDRTVSDTGVPFFSAIPLLGKLFDGNSDTNTKSELVIMVTPRVVESNEEWLQIRQKLAQELELLDIGQ
jgi:general secretion pathway protein D